MDIAESHFNVYCSNIFMDKNSLHVNGIAKYNEYSYKNDTAKTANSVSVRKYCFIKMFIIHYSKSPFS